MSNPSPEQIMNLACKAAQAASDASEAKQSSWYPCGFANIVIRPARGKFVAFLKSRNIGGKNYGGGYYVSSYDFSSQSQQWCQSMYVKADATAAAARVLREHGINADTVSRMD